MASALPVAAQDALIFEPPKDATMRLNSGSVVRGRLKRIAQSNVVMTLRTEQDKAYPFESVNRVSTTDGVFQFTPSQESFVKLLERASQIPEIEVRRDAAPGNGNGDPNAALPVNLAPRIFATRFASPMAPERDPLRSLGWTDSGFGSPNRGPRPVATLDLTAVAAVTEPPAAVVIATEGDTGEPAAENGEPVEAGPANPFGKSTMRPVAPRVQAAAAAPRPNAAPAPAAGAPPAAPPPPANPVAPAAGFSMETMPWWAKVGGFFGLIGVFWLVVQKR